MHIYTKLQLFLNFLRVYDFFKKIDLYFAITIKKIWVIL